jgi:aspartate racemase
VRRLADGVIEFVGRTDDQIKLRGFRIEPAEVEAALLEHDAVSAALVMLQGDQDPALVAYVVAENGADEAALRRFAGERLPAFATPSAVVLLDAFPLTRNGKVDRGALPAPEATAGAGERVPPRDDTEAALAEIWAELLGAAVGVTDDFFDLGGHSMMAVRMLTQVEQRFGQRLRLGDMVRSPTVRALAETLSGRSEEDDGGALVRLKPEGSRPPLFLIHSLTGDVLIYRDLVKRLHADQPAWGLEAIGADGEAVPMRGIPEMASHYIEKLRTVQPEGPYFMAGLCYGGAVAHEIAHQLEEAGHEVAFVGLIDANPLGVKKKVTVGGRIAEHLSELRAMPGRERLSFLRSTGSNVGERVRKQARRRVRRHLYINRGRALPPGLTDMTELNAAVTAGYVSPRYGGRVTLFRVHDPSDGDKTKLNDLRLRWDDFAAGGLDVRDVTSSGAGHISVLFEPHVAALGESLEAAISEALQERGA